MYALVLTEDNRVKYICDVLPNHDYSNMITVETLPEGNHNDYYYVDGKYVYDPIPEVEPSNVPVAPRNIIEGEYVTVDGTLYKAIVNIPNGESIVVGQNAVETTVEEQLYALTKGE